jgi:16S rRNA (cytidine1402-2'-O)-methyltransferase
VLDHGHRVSVVPGPTASVAALVVSGFPIGRHVFEGFVPRSGRERTERLAAIAAEPRTTVIYEAPHRIERTLRDLAGACGPDRPVVVARELTKLYEEVLRGTLGSIDVGTPRGEYVVVLGPVIDEDEVADDDTVRAAIREERGLGRSTRDAVTAVATRLGRPRREVYALAVGTMPSGPGTDDGGGTSNDEMER